MATIQSAHCHGNGKSNHRASSPVDATGFIATDPSMNKILGLVARVADTDVTVLIVGESGTGKELIARELHRQSSRRNESFLAVNCGAISEPMQEAEMFGHTRGAFTGAVEAKIGKFEAAEKGTLLLDEISEMPLGFQVKLLRLLEYGEYSPVGMAGNRYGNVRVIAATNRDLAPLIETGEFRRDLYYRLNLIRFDLPPLRQRRGEIFPLIDHFLQTFGAMYHRPNLVISAEAKERLAQYDFPGNVRELQNIVRRAVLLSRGPAIAVDDLPAEVHVGRTNGKVDVTETFHGAKARTVEEFEQAYLVSVLNACAGIVSRAALRAGLSERCFHEKLKKYGITSKEFRPRTDENISLD